MKCIRLAATAAVLLTGMAVPAFAAWDRIGTVDFTFRGNNDVQYGNFGGRVEALALRAQNSDVNCRDVTAEFYDGQRASVFHGALERGRDVTVDLPGNARLIRRLSFDCRSAERGGARVEIAADVGRYMAEWRRSPDWDRNWSRIFGDRDRGYVTGQVDTSGWMTLGSAQMNGRGEGELSFGSRGPAGTTIALRPTNDDARCDSVRVRFADGERVSLNIDHDRVLREDRVTSFDLPGSRRNVTNIEMNCRAEHSQTLNMEVLASAR